MVDKTLEMYEIAVAPWNATPETPPGANAELGTLFCESFTHQQYLIMFRTLLMHGQDGVLRMIAGFLDPEGGDEDRIGKDVHGKTIVYRGDLGSYGYFKVLPQELRDKIVELNS